MVTGKVVTVTEGGDMHFIVKGVKNLSGLEGDGFTASIYRVDDSGKEIRVAEVMDAANGGEFSYRWLDAEKAGRVDIHTYDYMGEPMVRQGTPEEKLFEEFAVSVEDEFEGEVCRHSSDTYANLLVDNYETHQWLKRQCRKKTLYRLAGDEEGQWRTVLAGYDERVKRFLDRKYGDQVERIANEELAAVA